MSPDAAPPPDDDRTAFGTSSGTPPPSPPLERPGEDIGPYRLVSVLGEGTFGTVWLAERRHPFVQSVAIKLVRPGMDSRAVLARFEQERQTLAVLNHPNVAKVLDGGLTALGRPYFAMEFVRGEPITDFCNRKRLGLRERLGLFRQVCEAVQHAHTKGIIHRDLKPSNILVTVDEGDRPVAKVIDFGIAKAVTGRMTDGTVMTESGLMIGTPAYMSPEQAEPGIDDVDTRTDVYSLGVILYELLAGLLPFDPKELRKKAYHEVQRMIREEDPPAPSARLTTIATRDAETASRIGAARRETIGTIAATLKRELEWIPLKAMRKERKERYATPGDLARDVENYLEGRPLVAAPESTAYRLRKFVRRNRVLVGGSAAVLASLVFGLGLAAVSYREATRQRDEARSARAEAEAARELAVASEARAVEEKEAAQAARDDAARERDAANAARETVEANAYVANIQMAASWLEQGFPSRARERLAACPPSRRGWEWSYLDAKSDRSLATVDLGESRPTAVHFTPDSRKLVVDGHDGTVSIVDLARGETIRSIRVDPTPGETSLLALSPDGKRFVRTVKDGAPRMHEVETGQFLFELQDVRTRVETLEFSKDGTLIFAIGTGSGQAWNAADGTSVRAFGRSDEFIAVRFDPDGLRVLLRKREDIDAFEVQDVRTGELLLAFVPGNVDVSDARFSEDGRQILVDGRPTLVDGAGFSLCMHDAADGSLQREIRFGSIFLWIRVSSPDGQRFATFDSQGGLIIFDRTTGAIVARRAIESPSLAESSATYSPDGSRLYTLRPDGTIVISDAATARIISTIPGAGNEAGAARLTVSPDGFRGVLRRGDSLRIVDLANVLPAPDFAGRITTSPSGETVLVHAPDRLKDNRVQLCRLDGEAIVALEGVSTAIDIARFSPDGTRVLTVSTTRSGRLHDTRDGRLISEFLGGKRDVTAAAFHPDGSIIATGSRDGMVRLWNGRTGAALAELPGHSAVVHCLEFAPDGSTLASGASDGTARLWDPVAQAARATLAGHPSGVQQIRFSRDGRTLATLTDRESLAGSVRRLFNPEAKDPVARIWDVRSGTLKSTLEVAVPAPLARVTSLDFSPDGRRAVLAGRGATCTVFEVADGSKWFELEAGKSRILAVRFNADGSRIAAIADDHRVLIFDATSGSTIAEFGGLPPESVLVEFSPDGTRLEVGPYETGETRVLDAIPHRIRYAERKLRSAGRLADLGSASLVEIRGASPATWLTDLRLAVHRPDLSSGPEDGLIRRAEDRRTAGLFAKSRRDRLQLASLEERHQEALNIAFEVAPDWMTAAELNTVAWNGITKSSPEEREASLDRLTTLAKLAVEKSGRKDSEILETLARVHWHRGEKEQAIEAMQEAIAVTEARPETEREFGHDMSLVDYRRTLSLYRRLKPGSELPAPAR